MPYHRVRLGRVLLFSLVLSALESRQGTVASSIYRYPSEREVIDEDIDSLIDRFHDEIAKEKPVIAPYGGNRHNQGYPYGLPSYDNEDSQPRRYYQAVRGQKTKMPAWDRGEGLVNQEEIPPPRGHHSRYGNRHHHHQEEEPVPQESLRHFQEQTRDQEPEKIEVPVQAKPEHIEKESNPKTDVKIAPVPVDIQEQDRPTHPTPAARQEFEDGLHPVQEVASMADIYFLAVVAGCSVAGLVGLVVAGVCWYRLQKNVKAASEVEYPAYGITGPTKEPLGSPGDRKLAQSAQMYHYQHQKQQMIALEKANGEMKNDGSEDDSDEENEEGDYTVYECPGLAPTGEMEVKNPLFSEETPVTPTPDDRREMK